MSTNTANNNGYQKDAKRYYDYDYDNHVILMFDADEANNLSLDLFCINQNGDAAHDEAEERKESSSSSSSSATTIKNENENENGNQTDNDTDEDEIILNNLNISNNDNSASNSKSSLGSLSRSNSGISWISSTSPKGKKTPYQLDIAHSYTLNESNTMISIVQPTNSNNIYEHQQMGGIPQPVHHNAHYVAYPYGSPHHAPHPPQQRYGAYPHPPHPPHHSHSRPHGHPHPHHPTSHPHAAAVHAAAAMHHRHHRSSNGQTPYLSPQHYHTPPHHPHGHRSRKQAYSNELPASPKYAAAPYHHSGSPTTPQSPYRSHHRHPASPPQYINNGKNTVSGAISGGNITRSHSSIY